MFEDEGHIFNIWPRASWYRGAKLVSPNNPGFCMCMCVTCVMFGRAQRHQPATADSSLSHLYVQQIYFYRNRLE